MTRSAYTCEWVCVCVFCFTCSLNYFTHTWLRFNIRLVVVVVACPHVCVALMTFVFYYIYVEQRREQSTYYYNVCMCTRVTHYIIYIRDRPHTIFIVPLVQIRIAYDIILYTIIRTRHNFVKINENKRTDTYRYVFYLYIGTGWFLKRGHPIFDSANLKLGLLGKTAC